VIVVPLLDSVLRGKQLGFKGVSSVALAIFGVGLLQLGSSLVGGTPAAFASGDAFCLAQAALFGVGYWRLEHVSNQYPTQTGRVTAGQLLGVALGSTIFCGLTTEMPTLQQIQGWMDNGFLLGGLVWTALVSTAMALYLETVALKAVSAAELTVLTTSVSLFGSAFAYLTMGEVMSPIGMVGGLLILAGCVVASFGGEKQTVDVLSVAATTGSLFSNEYLECRDKGSGLLRELDAPVPSLVNATVGGSYH
jgi:drug/metabolite transporter (DMT)-like permease